MTADRFIATGAFLILFWLPVLVQGLRKGRLYRRGPHGRIDRRRQPVQFWLSITASGMLALFGLTMLAYGLLSGTSS